LNYHLRSNSGSNGPIAKECHRFLVVGPFKFGRESLGHVQSCAVSNTPSMKTRYALILPLLHLAIAGPPAVHHQSKEWRFIPEWQAAEDFDKAHPEPVAAGMPWDPCYEYRLPSAGRLILAADFPVALLVGSSADECALRTMSLIPNGLKYYVRVKTRVILTDCLLALGIFVQWWLVGGWLDQRYTQSRPTRLWTIPIAVITVGGIVMAPTTFGQGVVAEIVNYFAGMIALLAWIVLIVMFAAVGTAWVIRRIRHMDSQPVSSHP
jgi:hypothetical protein